MNRLNEPCPECGEPMAYGVHHWVLASIVLGLVAAACVLSVMISVGEGNR